MRSLRTCTSTSVGGLMLAGMIAMAGPASAQDDQNCADFASQADAQAHYRANTSDPDGLDRDNDGIACENYTSYSDGSTDMTPIGTGTTNESDDTPSTDAGETDGDDEDTMVMPEGGVATGGGSTSGIEHGGLLVAGGLALTIGAGGTILAARRARA